MNLFANVYYDREEIVEWMKQDQKAFEELNKIHPELDIDAATTDDFFSWLQNDEESAKRYREYHYEKQWSNTEL